MNAFATALCLSLLVVLASCKDSGSNPLSESCGQLCEQTCSVIKQVFSIFSVFLGPFINTGHALCTQGCGLVCGIFG
ncbi:hypothetical protein RRG08_017974 [Elysia crispata]|uniref:Uncharacterized protein n=1 Tax=Elysia crispata TaxID=231223 RepID=A0AAE1DEN0_9GAST|nr:hypothetical protein RRG08_017974 [Elysia crispata]